jgi:hypothetical protein
VHFQIERLTVAGYSAAERERFTRSLRLRLSALAQKTDRYRWIEAKESRVERLDAGRLAPGAIPETAARQIATRIFDGLGKQEKRTSRAMR